MSEAVIVGVVGKPFGVGGDVYVRPDPDVEHDFAVGTSYRVTGRELTVAASRLHSGRRLVRFVGVDDRTGADSLRGLVLTVDRTQLTLDDDVYWTADLLGAEVVDEHGDVVGVVEAAVDGHAHDYLVVARPHGGEVLIPAVADLVQVTADGRVVVRAIPGLIDPESAD